MSKQDIQDAIAEVYKRRDRDLESFNRAQKILDDMENDIYQSKKADEKFLTESTYVPKDIEEIYEDRRKLYFDSLNRSDEARAELKSKKEQAMKEYDEELDSLNKKLKAYDEDEESEEKSDDLEEKSDDSKEKEEWT